MNPGAVRPGLQAVEAGGPISADRSEDPCRWSLLSIIESQIIPRLVGSIGQIPASNQQSFRPDGQLDDAGIVAFAQACLDADPSAADGQVDALLERDVGEDRIFLQLLAPAARQLGVWWEQDRCDFSQVTLALARLHQITHRLGYAYRDGPQAAGASRRVLLACAPGSHHLFGITLLAEFFRMRGWQVVVDISRSEDELQAALAHEWFEVVGLSLGLVEQIDAVAALVQHLRGVSRNPAVRVLLGGPAFLLRPMDPASLGVDGISTDAEHAVALAAALLRPGDPV
ncbi:MAG: cobalamin B12-binding domain-containing protein [Rhodoferax sp.]|nr:cobalamin B12-binding domain-containing protein [Rhodoferax sp.]